MTGLDSVFMSEREASLLNPLQLAYIGDSVWEIIIRSRLILQKKNVHHLHTECIRHVNAAAQASYIRQIRDALTEQESEIVLRGRNSHAKHPSPRNQSIADYSDATGFEALLGFLYLTGRMDRLHEIEMMILGDEDREWLKEEN